METFPRLSGSLYIRELEIQPLKHVAVICSKRFSQHSIAAIDMDNEPTLHSGPSKQIIGLIGRIALISLPTLTGLAALRAALRENGRDKAEYCKGSKKQASGNSPVFHCAGSSIGFSVALA
jgi:hypothetical protein